MKKIFLLFLAFFIYGFTINVNAYEILYSNDNAGGFLYSKNLDDTSEGQPLNFNYSFYFSVSPDGQYIIYSDNNYCYKKSFSVYGNGEKIFDVTCYNPTYSPDGQYIYYINGDDGNKLYKKSAFDSSVGFPLISNSTSWFFVTSDYIYYVNNNASYTIYRRYVSDYLDDGSLFMNISVGYYFFVSLDGGYIIYSDFYDGKLYKKSFATDVYSGGVLINSAISKYPFISPDGQYVYYSNFSDGGKLYKKDLNSNSDDNGNAVTSFPVGYFLFLPSSSSSSSSSSSEVCISYQPQTFTYNLKYDYSLYGKNVSDYFTGGLNNSFVFHRGRNETLQFAFSGFSEIEYYNSNSQVIDDDLNKYLSFFSGSQVVYNSIMPFTPDGEVSIKIYSGAINFVEVDTHSGFDDYDFDLYGISRQDGQKKLLGNFNTNTGVYLEDYYYNLSIVFKGYKFFGFSIDKILLRNYEKVYSDEKQVCYNSDTKQYTLDSEVIDYNELDDLGKDTILDVLKGKTDSIYKNRIIDEVTRKNSYSQTQYLLSDKFSFDDFFSSCSSNLENVNIGPFSSLSDLGFGPVKIPFTDIVFSFYPLKGVVCPLQSVYYMYNDLVSRF